MRSLSTLVSVVLLLSACSSHPTQAERWRAELAAQAPSAELTGPLPLHAYLMPTQRYDAGLTTGALGGSNVAIYDVSSLLRGRADFAGPEIGDLRPGAEGRSYDRLTGSRPGERYVGFEEAALIDLVRRSLPPRTRDDEDVSITIENGLLIVRHP